MSISCWSLATSPGRNQSYTWHVRETFHFNDFNWLQLKFRPSIFCSFLPPNVREHRTNNLVDIFAASACLFSDPGPGCHIVITRHLSPQLTPASLATLATDPNISRLRLRLSTRSFLRPSLLSIDVTEVSMFEVLIPDICPQKWGKMLYLVYSLGRNNR